MPDCSTCYCGIFGGKACMSGYKPEACTHWRLRYTCMGGKIFDEPLEKAPGCRLLLDRCEPCCKYGKGCLRMDVLFGKFTAEEIVHLLTEQDKQFLGIQRGAIEVPKRKSVAAEETMAEVRAEMQAFFNCESYGCGYFKQFCGHPEANDDKFFDRIYRAGLNLETGKPTCYKEVATTEPAQEAAPTDDVAMDLDAFGAAAKLAIEKGWIREVPASDSPMEGEPAGAACRVCGCTDEHACDTGYGIPCSWLEQDLCSNCAVFSCARPGDACPHCKTMGVLSPREPSYPGCAGCEMLRWAAKTIGQLPEENQVEALVDPIKALIGIRINHRGALGVIDQVVGPNTKGLYPIYYKPDKGDHVIDWILTSLQEGKFIPVEVPERMQSPEQWPLKCQACPIDNDCTNCHMRNVSKITETVIDGAEAAVNETAQIVNEKATAGYSTVPIALVYPNPNNPRKHFDPEALDKLTESIRQVGILEPLLVVRQHDDAACHPDAFLYRIVAGERRYRAAMAAGLETVPVIVRKLTEEQEFEVMLTENIQRQDLDPIEEAQAFRAAVDRGWKQEALAEKLGISQAQVANRLRLLKLPESVQESISHEIISAGHGLALVKVATVMPELAQKMAKRFQDNNIPVAQAGAAIDDEIVRAGKPLWPRNYGGPVFDYQRICVKAKCQYQVHAKERWGGNDKEHPFCIKSECWEKHQEEARQAKREEVLEKVRAQGRANGEDLGKIELPSLRDMPYDIYEEFTNYSEFKLKDCEPCEKIANALGHSDEVVKICTDTACWKKKKRSKTIAQGKETRAKTKNFEAVKLERIAQVMETSVTREELIYIAAKAVYKPATSAAWADHKVTLEINKEFNLPETNWWDEKTIAALIAKLREMTDLELGMLIFACQIRGIEEDDKVYQLTLGAAAGEEAEAVE